MKKSLCTFIALLGILSSPLPLAAQPAPALRPTVTETPKADAAFGAYQRGLYVSALKEAMTRISADRNDAPAMTLVGELYKEGLGVKRDPSEAARWYRLAANLGNREAIFALALQTLDGQGVAKDRPAAIALFVAAALQAGPASAQLPPGSYQRSCGNVRFDGEQLSAVCDNGSGAGARSRIYVNDCRGDITNVGGRLSCQSGGTERSRPDPRFEPQRRQEPRDYDGGGRRRERDREYRDYDGGGRDRERGGSLPGGSWRGSCGQASIEGSTLYAQCRTSRGDFRQNSVDVRRCVSFGNRDGTLVCE